MKWGISSATQHLTGQQQSRTMVSGKLSQWTSCTVCAAPSMGLTSVVDMMLVCGKPSVCPGHLPADGSAPHTNMRSGWDDCFEGQDNATVSEPGDALDDNNDCSGDDAAGSDLDADGVAEGDVEGGGPQEEVNVAQEAICSARGQNGWKACAVWNPQSEASGSSSICATCTSCTCTSRTCTEPRGAKPQQLSTFAFLQKR